MNTDPRVQRLEVLAGTPAGELTVPRLVETRARKPEIRAGDRVLSGPQDIVVVFDGPPGPVSGRFVEVETPDGYSIPVGEWKERPDGLWGLHLRALL